jgi:glucan phosphoethanolaminetransferase (alkaline phosphatase superfamily)
MNASRAKLPGGGKEFFRGLLPVLMVVCGTVLDGIIRFSYFRRMVYSDFSIYLVSILFEISLCVICLKIARRFKAAGYIFLFLYIFGYLGPYSFYMYVQALPGVNTFSYMFLVPQDFFGLAGDGLNPFYILIAAVCFVLLWIVIQRILARNIESSNRTVAYAGVVLVIAGVVLNHSISIKDNRALPFSNSLFSIINGYRDFQHGRLSSYNLMLRTVNLKKPEIQRTPEFNLLFVVNESLSAEYIKDFGYPLDTIPRISGFIARNRDDVFLFPRAYSNSTVTKVSVSNMLTGLNPIQGRYDLGKSPFFYEILKNNLSSYRTGLMTSWSYKPANFIDFIASPYLDFSRYQEKTGAKMVCNVSADDSLITTYFSDFIGGVGKSEKFCAVLHYGNTHYPYFSKPGDKVINLQNRLLTDYIASVHNLDRNISTVFQMLEDRGLLKNTVIIFTSDHGEAFGQVEKRYTHLGMFSVYTTHVPLWMYIPETVLAERPEIREELNRNTGRNVTNNDIFPTVLDLYGLKTAATSKFGRSLLSDIDPQREIFIFNGLKENRTDNHEYLGIVKGDEYFTEETNVNYARYCLFDLSDARQTHNYWGESIRKDSDYLASLKGNNLDVFIIKPLERRDILFTFLDGAHFGSFFKLKRPNGN